MRDSMEPENEIIKSIFNDDVDTLQEIVSKGNFNIDEFKLQSFDFLELFHTEKPKKLIDYSAAYGSIKCFKYLLLNHATVDQQTLGYAIFGGNTEIIRTIDQKSDEVNLTYIKTDKNDNPQHGVPQKEKPIKKMIVDSKIESGQLTKQYLNELINLSAKTGNAHSFIFCIDNGIHLSNNQELIINASKYGYHTLVEQILKYSKVLTLDLVKSHSLVSCGDVSIVKLICDKFGSNHRFILDSAIEYDYDEIVKFSLDENIKPETFNEIIKSAIEFDSTDSFKAIVNKYPLKKQSFNTNILHSYCLCSCSNRNYEISCILIDYLFYTKTDLTKFFFKSFFSGSEEICKYILDKKKCINLSEIINNYDKLFSVNSTIAVNLIDKFDTELKESLSRILFNESIKLKNKDIFELFIENNLDNRHFLIGAVNLRDIKLVKNVLEYKNNPSFINQVFKEGTALTIATSNGDIEIVKTLLELPGIDPNLSDKKGLTPLIIAISQLNAEMIGIFIDFYGDEIQYQTWQFKRSISVINDYYFNTDDSIDSKTEENLVFVLGGLLQIDEKLSLNSYSFLYNAIKKGMSQVVSFLFTIDSIDVNEKYNETGETALICAIKSNESQLAHVMLDHPNIDVNISAYDTQTALTCAAANSMFEIVQKIVNHPNFDPDSSNVNLAFYLSKDNKITNLFS